jgi:acylphosphatase
MLSQAHVYVKGDIIGVGFRAWTKIQAKLHHVVGWVRNVHDKPEIYESSGGVEAVLQGEKKDVAEMVELLRHGPPVARVDEIEVFWQEPKDVFSFFEIRK